MVNGWSDGLYAEHSAARRWNGGFGDKGTLAAVYVSCILGRCLLISEEENGQGHCFVSVFDAYTVQCSYCSKSCFVPDLLPLGNIRR